MLYKCGENPLKNMMFQIGLSLWKTIKPLASTVCKKIYAYFKSYFSDPVKPRKRVSFSDETKIRLITPVWKLVRDYDTIDAYVEIMRRQHFQRKRQIYVERRFCRLPFDIQDYIIDMLPNFEPTIVVTPPREGDTRECKCGVQRLVEHIHSDRCCTYCTIAKLVGDKNLEKAKSLDGRFNPKIVLKNIKKSLNEILKEDQQKQRENIDKSLFPELGKEHIHVCSCWSVSEDIDQHKQILTFVFGNKRPIKIRKIYNPTTESEWFLLRQIVNAMNLVLEVGASGEYKIFSVSDCHKNIGRYELKTGHEWKLIIHIKDHRVLQFTENPHTLHHLVDQEDVPVRILAHASNSHSLPVNLDGEQLLLAYEDEVESHIRTLDFQLRSKHFNQDLWETAINKAWATWLEPLAQTCDLSVKKVRDQEMPQAIKRRLKKVQKILNKAANDLGYKHRSDKSFKVANFEEWKKEYEERYDIGITLSKKEYIKSFPQTAKAWLKSPEAFHWLNRIARITDDERQKGELKKFNEKLKFQGGGEIWLDQRKVNEHRSYIKRKNDERERQLVAAASARDLENLRVQKLQSHRPRKGENDDIRGSNLKGVTWDDKFEIGDIDGLPSLDDLKRDLGYE
jgi:hypothetical protein